MKCPKCYNKLSFSSIIGWINSASNDLVCTSCSKPIAENYFLLLIYLTGGVFLVLGVLNIGFVSEVVGVSSFFALMLIIIIGIFVMISLAVLIVIIKKER